MTQTDPISPAQSRAAHAYAGMLLAPEVAGPAADDAIAAFRQTVASASATGGADSAAANETLLALTRLMTAVSMPDRSSPEDRRQAVWASIGSASHCTCREAAALLATRANQNIQPRESAALDEHLSTCAECRELSVRSVAADRAFRDALAPPGHGRGVAALPGGPRAGAALLAVVIAIAAGIFALSSGGSGSSGASAATVPTQTQTAEAVALTVPAVTRPAVHRHHVVHHAAKPKVVKPRVTHAHTTTTTPPATTTTSASAADASATPSATAATGTQSPATAASSPAATATPATNSASSTSSPSTAAQVSGPSSLPADSAPQQGIGSLTSTTP